MVLDRAPNCAPFPSLNENILFARFPFRVQGEEEGEREEEGTKNESLITSNRRG